MSAYVDECRQEWRRLGVPDLLAEEMAAELEARIDRLVAERPLPNVFIVPGATPGSAALDVGRVAVRRAERRAVEARDAGREVSDVVLRYLNRLSDLLFVLARREADEDEPPSRER